MAGLFCWEEERMDELEIQNLIYNHLRIKLEKEKGAAGEYSTVTVSIYYDNLLIDSDSVYVD